MGIRDPQEERVGILRQVWINAKDDGDRLIKRLVDMVIFPFKREDDLFALHVLFPSDRQKNTVRIKEFYKGWIK
jgi:hypothetical protein